MTSLSTAQSELKNLASLLAITEELLFSIPLNSDLVEKYLILRETGLKKSGLPVNNDLLWELQKKAHSELDEKHSFQEKQVKDLTENLAQYYQAYKDLLDISQNMLDFLRDFPEKFLVQLSYENNIETHSPCKDSIISIKNLENTPSISVSFSDKLASKSSIFLLTSNQAPHKNFQTEFSKLKEILKNVIFEQAEKKALEIKSVQEKYIKLSLSNQEKESLIQDLQKKVIFTEEQLNSKHETDMKEIKKTYTSEIDELRSCFKIQEARKVKEIQEIKEKYENDIRKIEEKNNSTIENLSVSLKNNYKQELKELELSFKHKEAELLEELDLASKTDSPLLKSLKTDLEKSQSKIQDLHEILRTINDKTYTIYLKYANKENTSNLTRKKEEASRVFANKSEQQYSELLTQLDYIEITLKKLRSDNEWLLEQAEILTREKENSKAQLKDYSKEHSIKDFSFEQVYSTLSANEAIVKDFQDARSKLLKQFADSKKNSVYQ